MPSGGVQEVARRNDLYDRTLEDMFRRVLRDEGSNEPPALKRVVIRHEERDDCVRLTAVFDRGGREWSTHRRLTRLHILQAGMDILPDRDCIYQAEAIWSHCYEDHYIRRTASLARSRIAQTAQSSGEYEQRLSMLAMWETQAARAHSDQFRDEIRQSYRVDLEAIAPTGMSSTEVRARAQEVSRRLDGMLSAALSSSTTVADELRSPLTSEMLQQAARAIGRNPFHDQWRSAFSFGLDMARSYSYDAEFLNVDVGSPEANERGLKLLRENLTPAQLKQYNAHSYFDVQGGKSSTTYRIHHGRQMNIRELDDNGDVVCGWCFLPQGGLVAGDIMLAQKTALELYEDEALKIANRF